MFVLSAERNALMEMKTCPKCGIPKPKTSDHYYPNKDGKLWGCCKVCWNERSRANYHKEKQAKYRPQKNESLLTTKKEREEDGYKCLAIDVLTLAVLGHKEGDTDPGFWNSWNFELFCAMADMNPEYIRRGIGVGEAPILEETA